MKKWSITNNSSAYLAGMAFYLIGLNLFVYSFRYKDIAIASALLIIFNIISLTAAGFFFFGESMSLKKIIGLLLFGAAILFFEME